MTECLVIDDTPGKVRALVIDALSPAYHQIVHLERADYAAGDIVQAGLIRAQRPALKKSRGATGSACP